MNRRSTATRCGTIVLGLAVAATALASCSDGGADPQAQGERGGTLRVAVDSVGAEEFDPALYTATPQQTYYSMIFDPLIDVGEDGGLTPGLAEEWTPSSDGLTWTVELREDATFHDGSPVTAEDAAFTLTRYLEGSGVGASRMKEYIASVAAVDEHTLEVVTNGPAPAFPYDVALGEGTAAGFVVPKAVVEEIGPEEFAKAPIGSGPFALDEVDPGRGISFASYEDYWGGAPKVDAVELQIIADQNARLNLLRSGEVDIVSGLLGPSVVQAESDSNIELTTVEKSNLSLLAIGAQGDSASPLSSEGVRAAMSLAMDRQGVVDTLLGGYGEPAPLFGFPRGLGWPDDAESMLDEFDLDAARQALAEAGYPDGFDLDLFATTAAADMADAVAQSWGQIGIKVRQRIEDQGAVLDEAYSEQGKKNTRVVMIFGPTGAGSRIDVSSVLTNHLNPVSTVTQYGEGVADEIAEVLAEQARTVDETAREELVFEVMDLNRQQRHVIPMWFVDSVFASSLDVSGWEPVPGQPYPSNLQSVSLSG